ncbi:Rossmann-like domain-containing protein [Thermococcus sp.]
MILRKLKKEALRIIDEDFTIVDFSFALPYTYVVIEGKRGKSLGVAMTLPEEIQMYSNEIEDVDVGEFIKKVDSLNIIERTLAIATINAVSQYYIDLSKAKRKDVTELLDDSIEKVAVIGNMHPIVKTLKERGFDLYVFERNLKLWDRETLSDSLEYWLLPEMDAIIVSGSALVNATLDMILERSKKVKLIVLTGPTAQLLPELLEGSGVTHLASMKVLNTEKALIRLKLGSFRGFEQENKKYILEVPENG